MPPASPTFAQQPLLLVMPIKPGLVNKLRDTIRDELKPALLNAALDQVGTVHSTRFVILDEEAGAPAKLIVVAIYDGTPDDYIGAFARQLKGAFNLLLPFISDYPEGQKVEEHVQEFTDYVKARDVKPVHGRTYLANPGLTVLDIWEAMSRNASTPDIRRMNHDHS